MTPNYEKSYYQAGPSKKGVSRMTFILVVITTVVVSFIVYHNIDNIQELFTGGEEIITEEDALHIGDRVELSGFLMDDGDIRTYSHTLETIKYNRVGLKSREIKLDQYEGEVTIQGEVERLQGSMFIIEVEDIDGEKSESIQTGDDQIAEYNSGKYFGQAGIYFPEHFFNQFELLNQGEGGKIQVKNLGSNQEIDIKYFECNSADTNKDCNTLEKNFSNAGEKSFQTVNGVVMYKLYEVESRFARSDYHGYFINDVAEAEVASLAQYMQVVNGKLIDETIKPHISKLCQTEGQAMETIQKYENSKQGNEVIVSLEGTSKDGVISCELSLNPNLVLGATTINVSYEAAEVTTGDIEELAEDEVDTEVDTEDDGTIDLDDLNYSEQEEDAEDALANYDGEQFPINLQKAYTFESRRGHSIIFPSSNISFAGVNVSTNLGEDGVNCFSQMNVVKYGTSEEDRDANPSIKIYECSIKDAFVGSSKYRQIEVGEDKHFIIETVDPARANFADHVEIE